MWRTGKPAWEPHTSAGLSFGYSVVGAKALTLEYLEVGIVSLYFDVLNSQDFRHDTLGQQGFRVRVNQLHGSSLYRYLLPLPRRKFTASVQEFVLYQANEATETHGYVCHS